MGLPVLAPEGYQGQNNLYLTTFKFEQGRKTWQEHVFAIVKASNFPIILMRQAGINLSNARLFALSPRAKIKEVRSSLVANDPLYPVRASYAGDDPADGANFGIGTGTTDSPVEKCWDWAWYDASLSVRSKRPYRGMLQADDTWTVAGGYAPTPQTLDMMTALLSVLSTPQTSGLATGTARYVIPSTQFLPANSPPQIALAQFTTGAPPVTVFPLSVNGLNQIVIKFQAALPLQKGWTGITPGVPLTPVVVGDQVILSGPRVACLNRINGVYRICSISSSGAGASTVWTYTTTRYACCSPSQLPLWTGNMRADQAFYVPFDSGTPIQIATRSTGVGGGGPRGKSRTTCCG